jgi:hypothetical protein
MIAPDAAAEGSGVGSPTFGNSADFWVMVTMAGVGLRSWFGVFVDNWPQIPR